MSLAATRPTSLVLCFADPAGNPRPNRIIKCLSRDFDVHVISAGPSRLSRIHHEAFIHTTKTFAGRLVRNANLLIRHYRPILWPPSLRAMVERHRALDHALISVHELRLLPFALAVRNHGRILFDAREYYPRHYEDVWWWRLLHQPLNRHLCRDYLHQADHVVTVCQGLADEYRREFGITCSLLPSYPAPVDCTPSPVDAENIRLVHHGLASQSRKIERMIEMMDHLHERFSLDLILMPSDVPYMASLRAMCATRPRVRVLPPLPFAQLVEATNSYDIGVFLVPPGNFNLRFTLPNKFFEYIQARLMVAIGPSPEMARLVQAHNLGVVSPDFAPATLAGLLNRLTPEDIENYKAQAHQAARVLNSDHTDELVRSIALGSR